MIDELTINIVFVLITFQFLITCVVFYQKNQNVKGIKPLTLAALSLFAMLAVSLINTNKQALLGNLMNAIFFAFTYYFLCRAFIELLNIRGLKRLEMFWGIFTVFSCAAIVAFDVSSDMRRIYLEIVIGIIPIAYLLYLLHKKHRSAQYDEEVSYLSYMLMFMLLVRVIYICTFIPLEVIPNELTQYIPKSLNIKLRYASVVGILFVHLSLAIAFLMLVFRFKEIELKKMGDTDPLTGILNRKAFFERISNMLDPDRSYFIMIDADFFKKINDNYGHVVGDKALKHIANVVSKCVSESDVFARYGGEEFIVAITNSNELDVKNIAERIRHKMESTPLNSDGLSIQLTLSIGVSSCSGVDSLKDIERADKVLYQAKQNGRNQAAYCFS